MSRHQPKKEKRPTVTIDLGKRWRKMVDALLNKSSATHRYYSRATVSDVIRAGLEALGMEHLTEEERAACGYPDKRIWRAGD